jgi:hypothetical protein
MTGDIQRFSQNNMEIAAGYPSMREKPKMRWLSLFRVFQINGRAELKVV